MAINKFLHEEIFRGKDYAKKFATHSVTICGAGALGSNLVDHLSRMAVSKMRVIDFDRVDTHNISSQIFSEPDVGALKVEALKTKVFRNVGVEIEAINKKLEANNVKKLLKDSTLVVDCFDNTEARQLVYDECKTRKIPCLHLGVNGSDGGFGEVGWNEQYKVPQGGVGDVCEYPLARTLAVMVVCIGAEEILDFCLSDKPRRKNWFFTLGNLKIWEK